MLLQHLFPHKNAVWSCGKQIFWQNTIEGYSHQAVLCQSGTEGSGCHQQPASQPSVWFWPGVLTKQLRGELPSHVLEPGSCTRTIRTGLFQLVQLLSPRQTVLSQLNLPQHLHFFPVGGRGVELKFSVSSSCCVTDIKDFKMRAVLYTHSEVWVGCKCVILFRSIGIIKDPSSYSLRMAGSASFWQFLGIKSPVSDSLWELVSLTQPSPRLFSISIDHIEMMLEFETFWACVKSIWNVIMSQLLTTSCTMPKTFLAHLNESTSQWTSMHLHSTVWSKWTQSGRLLQSHLAVPRRGVYFKWESFNLA